MAFDSKTTLAHQLLGRNENAPLQRRTVGQGIDLFFRPNGMAVLIGSGPSYLMVGPRVNLEKATLAFVRGVRTPPAGTSVLPPVESIAPASRSTDALFAAAA